MGGRLLLSGLIALGALAPCAHAATPSSGSISAENPSVAWTGKATSFESWTLFNDGEGACLPLSCDTFSLTVADPGALRVSVAPAGGDAYVELVTPDATSLLFGSADSVTGLIGDAEAGTYVVHVVQSPSLLGTYAATAELLLGAAAPPAPAVPTQLSTTGLAPRGALTLAAAATRAGRSIAVGLQSTGTLTNVAAALTRGRRVVARGTLLQLAGTSTVTLRARRAVRAGRYVLRAAGTDDRGRLASAQRRITLK